MAENRVPQPMFLLIGLGIIGMVGANGLMLAWVASEAGMPTDMARDVVRVYVFAVAAAIAGALYPHIEFVLTKIQKWRSETA